MLCGMPPLLPLIGDFLLSFGLAEMPPADPTSAQSAGWLLLGLGGLALCGNQLMSAVLNWRKLREPELPPPPLCPVECARLKVLEAEIRAVEMRVEKRISEILGSVNTRLSSLENTLSHIVGDFNYALGKIDGREQ